MRGYGLVSAALIALYLLLAQPWRHVVLLVVLVGALLCVAHGRRRVPPRRRLPWTLLLAGLVTIVVAAAVRFAPGMFPDGVGLLLDAAGNILVRAAALALIIRRGSNDLGGIIDTTIVALAAGGLIWGVLLPHRLGTDTSVAAQVNLFVGVFALTGVLGALLRLYRMVAGPSRPLWWLMGALASGIGVNVAQALADGSGLRVLGDVFLLLAFTSLGLFGLDPEGPRLAQPGGGPNAERLTIGRLVFLGLAVAVTPVVIGVREVGGGGLGGLLLAVQGALVATLVMTRIGLLSQQRAAAERALNYQATHDPLTHLPNRREFVARLSRELADRHRCLLLFCDLDDFKMINDKYGHAAGDRMLVEVADRLTAAVEAPGFVSRFGGDEFVVLLVDAKPADGEAVRERISRQLDRPYADIGNRPLRVSVGVSPVADGGDPEDLIRSADRSMYRAKAGRRGSSAELARFAYEAGR
jgi:diguanylate cyclase (GGDEF)-like protein